MDHILGLRDGNAVIVFLKSGLSILFRRIPRQHVFNSVVLLSDASQLGGILKLFTVERIGNPLQTINDCIKESKWGIEEIWFLADSLAEHLKNDST